MWPWRIWQLLLAALTVQALWEDTERWKQFGDGSDLQNFISRPEIKAPRYVVAKHRPEAITPGYWFVAPQGPLLQRVYYANQREYAPCVNGPLIYDGDGELIWSGACQYDNRVAMNFHPIHMNGSNLLAFWISGTPDNLEESEQKPRGGILMNDQYDEISRTTIREGHVADEHEFKVIPSEKTGLFTTRQRLDADASITGQQGTRRISVFGFQEVELATNKPLFNWSPLEHGVLLNESCDTKNMHPSPSDSGHAWDYFHLNSVEKFANGDYLISARHTSTVYRIANPGGQIIWRLGGCYGQSDFVMHEGVPFFWQHDARIYYENATHIIMSIFDNESEFDDVGEPTGRNPPVGKIIALDTASKPMTATLLRHFDRPDKLQTPAEGGMILIGGENVRNEADIMNSHVLVNWAFDGYMSEYNANDELVMEARFVSDRHRNYRAFKFPWVGNPKEPPTLKILPIGYAGNGLKATSAFFVSWNGATQVCSWRFHGGKTADERAFQVLATVDKRGFETSWVATQVVSHAYAEALDTHGRVLGRSARMSIGSAPVDAKSGSISPANEMPETADMPSFIDLRSPMENTKAIEVASKAMLLGFAVYGMYAAGQHFLVWRRKSYRLLPSRRQKSLSSFSE